MEIEQKERERIEEWAEIHFGKYGVQAVATAITSKQAEHQHLQKEVIQPMQSVMIAAAEEIQRCWPAHCDAEGYGPTNLMHRLEKGIPSQYGYTAGAFAKLEAENKALREAAGESRDLLLQAKPYLVNAGVMDTFRITDVAIRIDQLLKNEG